MTSSQSGSGSTILAVISTLIFKKMPVGLTVLGRREVGVCFPHGYVPRQICDTFFNTVMSERYNEHNFIRYAPHHGVIL